MHFLISVCGVCDGTQQPHSYRLADWLLAACLTVRLSVYILSHNNNTLYIARLWSGCSEDNRKTRQHEKGLLKMWESEKTKFAMHITPQGLNATPPNAVYLVLSALLAHPSLPAVC